jgi:prevent-host-death family protein
LALPKSKTPKLINAFTARTHLGRLITQVSEKRETYVLTKKGKPKVVLLGIDEYEELVDIVAEQRDRAFQRALKESAAQIKRGEVSSVAALRAIYRGR